MIFGIIFIRKEGAIIIEMATKVSLESVLKDSIYPDSIMDTVSSHLSEKGYQHISNCPSEIIIQGCTKETGFQLVMDATGETRSHIKHGFQMVANKNNLYIRKKYKETCKSKVS